MGNFNHSDDEPTVTPVNRATGIGLPPKVPDWNPDAKILALRGVSGLKELNEKYEYGEMKPGNSVNR